MLSHLRPTAAFFLSDLHIRNAEAKMARKHISIEPVRYLSALIPTITSAQHTQIGEIFFIRKLDALQGAAIEFFVRWLVVVDKYLVRCKHNHVLTLPQERSRLHWISTYITYRQGRIAAKFLISQETR